MSEHQVASLRVVAAASLAEVDRGNRLLADYLAGVPAITGFFSHAPAAMTALAARPRAGADPTALAAALVAFQGLLGADARALANARRLADPTVPVVVVGQQPGLLTGPLYTLYKALTAISLARRLHGVPVFWVGADDDDRAEVDHCACWDARGGLRPVRYPEGVGQPGLPVGDLPAGAAGAAVLAQVDPLLEGQPGGEETRRLLRETLAESSDFGEWFCRLLSRLLGPLGLVICDPRLPALRQLSAEVLRREIATPLHTTALVNARAAALQECGYRPQLTKPEDRGNFFLMNATRQRVAYADGRFHVEGRSFSGQELLTLLDYAPERFIPNAVLRPLVQEYLFGSSAFVAGPNELGYWAQLAPVFEALDVPMPPVLPRAGATLVPAPLARLLREWELPPLDLLYDFPAVRYRLLAQAQPPQVAQRFTAGRATIERLVAELSEAIAGVDATLAGSALATHQRMLNELERLERKTLKALERRSDEHALRLEGLRETLFPGQGLQERVVSPVSLLARKGEGVIAQLDSLLDKKEGDHLFVEL